ncbi:MAG: hypothetical protein JSU04_13560 [Bdellovibrionales bacterium]|nr:hypothetical protein [Bdellovibrionales bacterium]
MKHPDAKSEKYFNVSRAILEMLEQEGVAALSHTAISRKAKVSRAWIYEYMGRDRQHLLDIASETFGSYFTKTNISVEILTPADLLKLLRVGHEMTFAKMEAEPILIKLYFRFKGTKTPMGATIKKYEKHWLDYMSEIFMRVLKYDEAEASNICQIIQTLRLGFCHRIVTSAHPIKEKEEALKSLELIHQRITGLGL